MKINLKKIKSINDFEYLRKLRNKSYNIMSCDIKIISADLIGHWNWDLKITECIICKTNLNDPYVGKLEKGICGHAFHKDCIHRWIRQKNSCPFCNTEWTVDKEFKGNYNM